MPPMISVVIPVFNKVAYTKSTLTALFRQPIDVVEIIVVDNASTDSTETELRAIENSNFRYVRNATNLGFGAACNIGYANATGSIVCFLNNDIRIKDDSWLSTIINAIEDNYLVGPTAGYVDPKNDYKFLYETTDNNKPTNYMSGWCLAANKDTWSRLNIPRQNGSSAPQIFDERFFLYYEDTDVGLTSKQRGIQFRLVDIPVVHFGKVSSSQLNTNKWYNTSRQIFLKKWRA